MSHEVQLTFEWEGLALAGSLHLPSGPGPHPAVVMAQGSGPADRDSGGYFVPIREMFVDRGIATLAFDKPGCGSSSGDWHQFGLLGRADQLVAAIELVRAHAVIDSQRVGVWGHSQGGWLVQMLAGRPVDIAFAVASSAPSIGVADQLLYDCEQTLRGKAIAEPDLEDALQLTRTLLDAAASDAPYESVRNELIEPASTQSWYDGYPTVADADDWLHTKLLVNDEFKPLQSLQRVECSFLAVYGALDSLLPAWQGAQDSGVALAHAPTPDSSVVVFPDGDHRIQDPTKSLVDGYLNLLGDWVSRRVVRS